MKLTVSVEWTSVWYSAWLRGRMTGGDVGQIERIYKHDRTGQIRVYSKARGWPFNEATISVNGGNPITLYRRGGSGRLHLSRP